jgi:glycosyltransferase involved in cell wall biosynthesis
MLLTVMPASVAVVIPCYRVSDQILDVLSRIGSEVNRIFVIDDACPDGSGQLVQNQCCDPRVCVLRHAVNRGVGAAVMTGYAAALAAGALVIVKVDGDGQMEPALIPRFIAPILNGQADYTKGNRFYDLTHIGRMPVIRLIGNAVLSFMAKLSTGYWNLFDTTNGFTAIHAKVARRIAFEKVSERYFFETDILFRLNIIRAVVVDVAMDASYQSEVSNLRIGRVMGEFFFKHMRNFGKRIFYNYFLRDMTAASLELVLGLGALSFGLIFGAIHWLRGISTELPTPLGTIMLAALPTMLGLQLVLAFITFDVANVPRRPIHVDLPD